MSSHDRPAEHNSVCGFIWSQGISNAVIHISFNLLSVGNLKKKMVRKLLIFWPPPMLMVLCIFFLFCFVTQFISFFYSNTLLILYLLQQIEILINILVLFWKVCSLFPYWFFYLLEKWYFLIFLCAVFAFH